MKKHKANFLLTVTYYLLPVVLVCSCGRKSESTTIITTMDTTLVASKDTIDMGNKQNSQQVKWGDKTYTLTITRKADKSLPKVKDSQDSHYYDNTVTVLITGPEGEVMNHTFTKKEFMSQIDPEYIKPSMSVLSSIVFKEVSDGKLKLVASVGSPDEMDETYMLVQITVDKHGNFTKKLIDNDDDNPETSD